MNNEQPTYVYETPKYEASKAENSIGPAILIIGALATAGLWIDALMKWLFAVAANPFSRPYEAAVALIICCVAAYFGWRTVRMAYLMACSLCFLTYDSGRKLLHFLNQQRKH